MTRSIITVWTSVCTPPTVDVANEEKEEKEEEEEEDEDDAISSIQASLL
mgnify:CR=1 FL=1